MGYAARKRAQEAELAQQARREWEELPEAFFPTYWPVADDVAAVRPHHDEPCFCLLHRVKFWYPVHYMLVYEYVKTIKCNDGVCHKTVQM